ncbi:hypothetical protein [Streptomyces barkulensis]|uniref:hypothetical protein n=1 Tax=Streptomyces barkulensis TaxID=1257026 RepID=UPI00187E55D2|nr:hypothetical protein [Streptomyces barkulensis]
MTAPGSAPAPWVVVPARDEGTGTGAARAALATQTDTGLALAVVHSSLRRPRARGARRTLLWYRNRRCRPADPKQVHAG